MPVSWDAVDTVDEGLPIAYEVLEKGVPVLASDGEQVGTVHHVVAAPEKDIFHGLVIITPGRGRRFVEAADVASLHEHGVDLRIDSAAVREPARAGWRGAGLRRGPGRDEGLAALGTPDGHARRLAPRALSDGEHRRRQGHGRGRFRRAPARARGGDPLAAGGALLSRASGSCGGGLRTADAVSARPRSNRPLQGVPPADAQDAGVRRASRATTTGRGSPTRSRSPRSRAPSRGRCA